MNIAIDISPLSSGHQARGTGVYTRCLLDALKMYAPHHKYHLVSTNKPLRESVDLVHYPFFDPFFLTLPKKKTVPTVVTIHDVIPLVFPDKFPPGIRGKIKWLLQKRALTSVTRVITDSNCSKQDIVRLAGVPEDKIDVVYLAPAPGYTPVTDSSILHQVKKKYHLPDTFVLYVGDVNWNKNVLGLLDAQANTNIPLVVVGKAFLDETLPETQEINKRIATLGIEERVQKLGFVQDTDLPAIYSLACSLVQPSWYEGFGLPVLEAFACGCPVISSASSSLAEINGPAIPIAPEHPESITQAIETMAAMTAQQRNNLIQEGFTWVKQFTWEKTAKKTVSVYERSVA